MKHSTVPVVHSTVSFHHSIPPNVDTLKHGKTIHFWESKELLYTCFWKILQPSQKLMKVLCHGLYTCNWLPTSLPVASFVLKGGWFCLRGGLPHGGCATAERLYEILPLFSVISRGSPSNIMFCIALSATQDCMASLSIQPWLWHVSGCIG